MGKERRIRMGMRRTQQGKIWNQGGFGLIRDFVWNEAGSESSVKAFRTVQARLFREEAGQM